jgi:N-acylglucosamine 2-epimerase
MMRRLMELPATAENREILDFALRETRIMGEFGWDDKEGGIWYFRDALGKPISRHEYFLKAWWPQCEAATAMLRAYALSRDEYFLEFFRKTDAFAWNRLGDRDKGEWFAYAPIGGRLHHSYKGSRFKGFFHLPRYLLDCIQTIRWMENS